MKCHHAYCSKHIQKHNHQRCVLCGGIAVMKLSGEDYRKFDGQWFCSKCGTDIQQEVSYRCSYT